MEYRRSSRAGFTMVEIMVVVLIIGLLSVIAIPAYFQVKTASQATALANDLRNFASVFNIYATEEGMWPPDQSPGVTPPELAGQLPRFDMETAIGGNYDWDMGVHGYTAAVSVFGSTSGPEVLARIDKILDDGIVTTGDVIVSGDRLSYILQP